MKALMVAILNSCYIGRLGGIPSRMYARSLSVREEDSLDKAYLPRNADFIRSVLINEGALET